LELEREFSGGLRSRWYRDRLGRPEKQETLTGGGFRQRIRTYKWQVNDRLQQIDDTQHGVTRFGHDEFGNLAWSENPDGSTLFRMPDAVGNLFRTKDRSDRKYGRAGELLQSGRTKYKYDAEGNLIRKTEEGGKEWCYKWNGSGMLSQVIRPDEEAVTFTYDALGRRLSKSFRGRTTRWIWDGNTPLHEWVEQANIKVTAQQLALQASANGGHHSPELVTWLFEPESFAPLAKLTREASYDIVSDHLGTPLSMHGATGEAVWSADLNAYGEVVNLRGKAEDCPFRYPGQYEDVETSLYYNRFRYYDAREGIYISQDPAGLEGGIKSYSYVKDALIWIDKFGLSEDIGLLNRKLGALEKAQNTAANTRELPDGRTRYYGQEKLSSKPGATRGASLVTEYDPKRGNVRQWMESYDHKGNVIRVHPKMKNGEVLDLPHYPPTGKEIVDGQVVQTKKGKWKKTGGC
jgi:RHS repeat-associated protein